MLQEKNYDFLKRMQQIHIPGRRDHSVKGTENEVLIDESWKIAVSEKPSKKALHAAMDFQDYLLVSMELSLPVIKLAKGDCSSRCICFLKKEEYSDLLSHAPEKSGSFAVEITKDNVLLCGADDNALLYAMVYLEDRMNLAQAPILPLLSCLREDLTRMRSIHSGAGVDKFPQWQFDAILHAGFNAVDLFLKDIDTVSWGHCDVASLIDEADSYGLGVVLSNYIRSFKHPDDPDAEEFFDSIYGEVARRYTKAKAISLVGESLEFPSKDPATTGKRHRESMTDGIPDTRPSPGWYPCSDYPAYISRIRDAVHRVNPDMEVIFSTYNWGWTPYEVRKKFLENLPEGVTLQITYEIFKQNRKGDLACPVMDYTISAVEPGYYFTSEAEIASSLGIPIRATANLAGCTWDFGTAPYVPVPQRWIRKMLILKQYLEKCGVKSFYDNHHYGWTPNVMNDLEKEIFNVSGEKDLAGFLLKLAERDYGKEAAEKIVKVWEIWSSAMDFYVASNEDQYGPWRTGPSYPFIFQPNITRTMSSKEIAFPTEKTAHFGNRIIKTLYTPYENENQSPGPLRYPRELRDLREMLRIWKEGLALLEEAKKTIPEGLHSDNAQRLFALGSFILHSIMTTIHIKEWWLLNIHLQASSERKEMLAVLDKLEALAAEEMDNAAATIPHVETDSRIGWEPSMEYVCDKWHLEWKKRQMESMLREVRTYRKMVEL